MTTNVRCGPFSALPKFACSNILNISSASLQLIVGPWFWNLIQICTSTQCTGPLSFSWIDTPASVLLPLQGSYHGIRFCQSCLSCHSWNISTSIKMTFTFCYSWNFFGWIMEPWLIDALNLDSTISQLECWYCEYFFEDSKLTTLHKWKVDSSSLNSSQNVTRCDKIRESCDRV